MKKLYIIAIAFSLGASQFAVAQLSISPDPVFEMGVEADDFEGIGHSLVTNEAAGQVNLTWSRSVIDQTEGWTSAVCDLNQCYLAHISTQTFDLGGGADGTLDVHVYPNGIEGGSIIEIIVHQTLDPDVSASAMYYFNQTVDGIAERFSNAIKVYPNPTQDYISLADNDFDVNRLELYNVSGKLIKTISINGLQQVSIADIASGNYILKMMDVNGNIVSTNLLVKE